MTGGRWRRLEDASWRRWELVCARVASWPALVRYAAGALAFVLWLVFCLWLWVLFVRWAMRV